MPQARHGQVRREGAGCERLQEMVRAALRQGQPVVCSPPVMG